MRLFMGQTTEPKLHSISIFVQRQDLALCSPVHRSLMERSVYSFHSISVKIVLNGLDGCEAKTKPVG